MFVIGSERNKYLDESNGVRIEALNPLASDRDLEGSEGEGIRDDEI